MRKILSHINILLALLLLLVSSNSAYGQSDIELTITGVSVDGHAVDLGLDVYWADQNVGASSATDVGDFIRGYYYVSLTQGYPIDDWSDSQWPNWRVPTQNEANLLSTKFISYSNDICTFSNNVNTITVPTTPYRMGGSFGLKNQFAGSGYMFWTSDGTGSVFGHIRSYYVLKYDNNAVGTSTKLEYVNGLPLRPVIDKVTVTLKSGDKTVTQSFPKGSEIQISAERDDCYIFKHWIKDNNTNNTITTNNYSFVINADVTYEAIFESKETTITASYTDGGTAAISNKAADDKYDCSDVIEIKATPDNCYSFKQWVVYENGSTTGVPVTDNNVTDDEGNNTLTIIVQPDMDNNSYRYEAEFEEISFTVNASCNDESLGNANSNPTSTVKCGKDVTITAEPKGDCIYLSEWKDKSDPTAQYDFGHDDTDYKTYTDADGNYVLTIFNVNRNIDIQAIFNKHNYVIDAETDGHGSVTQKEKAGSDPCERYVTLIANAEDCYKFGYWTKKIVDEFGVTKEQPVPGLAQLNLTQITEDATYVAHFVVKDITVTIKSDTDLGTVKFVEENQ